MARRFPNSHLTSCSVAVTLISFYLGEASDRVFDELFAPRYDDPRRAARLVRMAEAIFALRREPGFQEICRRFRERGRQSIFFEAMSAAMFCSVGFAVHARPERSILTEDFDFEARLGERAMAVEVTELKAESFSRDSFLRALNKKRRQLPPDEPCCLHCHYPAAWKEQNSNLEAEMAEVAVEFLRRSRRVNFLILSTEEHRSHGNGFAYLYWRKTYRNSNPRHDVGDADGRISFGLPVRAHSGDFMQTVPTDQNWSSGEFQMFVDYVSDLGEFNKRRAAGVYGGMPPSAGS
jgi:hypothetical protein